MKKIIIESECEFSEDYPDKHDWIEALEDLIRELEEQPEDCIPTDIIATVKKSEWEEYEIEKGGRVMRTTIKTKPSLTLEMI